MNCDFCDKPAVVHEVTVKSGVKSEVHLCETHAREAGIPLPGEQPINQLLTQFVISKPSRKPPRAAKKTCPNCGMSFARFRQAGVVGCPQCYETFESQLTPMIERAQNGGTSHAGKCPRRGGASLDRQLLIQRMVKELEDAVGAEQYERAAELRDQLEEMSAGAPGAEPNGEDAKQD